jgi:hypothetical protein
LQENTSYWFTMVCTDRDNGLHASSSIQFTTGINRANRILIICLVQHKVHHRYK